MIMTNRLLPVALVAALIGGSVGAFVMSRNSSANAETQTATLDNARTANAAGSVEASDAQYQANQAGKDAFIPAQFDTASEQGAFKNGFAEGFAACQGNAGTNRSSVGTNRVSTAAAPTQRVVYRNSGSNYRNAGSRNAHSSSSRTVYSDNQPQPRRRSFWQKHRDKLTVAMGTGGGAVVGGLIGGKKGAAIGALSGAGGSALYTYKLRNRNKRY